MRLKCNRCGKDVSTPVPDETVIHAWVECPACCLGQRTRGREAKKLIERAVELMTVQQLSQWKGVRAFQEEITSSDVISPAE